MLMDFLTHGKTDVISPHTATPLHDLSPPDITPIIVAGVFWSPLIVNGPIIANNNKLIAKNNKRKIA